jgi:serine/threonine-protein kinase
MALLRLGHTLESYVTGHRYVVTDRLGQGGYAEAYQGHRVDALGRRRGEDVCLKVTLDERSWHREAYFGELLAANQRVIAVYDTFPKPIGSGINRRMAYCLVMELAESGSLASYVSRRPRPWPETRIRREMLGLLGVLVQLHDAGAMHRDLTPFNVFVCHAGVLKLGDFGIARHASNGHSLLADEFNGWFASTGLFTGDLRRWLTADDVWQMGQLMGVLIRGDCESILSPSSIRHLPCSAAMRTIVAKCIGPRSIRYHDAYEMLQAIHRLRPPTSTSATASRQRSRAVA